MTTSARVYIATPANFQKPFRVFANEPLSHPNEKNFARFFKSWRKEK
jgi:hypothetical protein